MIKPRTVTVTIEIHDAESSLVSIKADVTRLLDAEGYDVRSIQTNVIDATKPAKRPPRRRARR